MPIYTSLETFNQLTKQKGVGSVEKNTTIGRVINMGRVCINTAHVYTDTAHVCSQSLILHKSSRARGIFEPLPTHHKTSLFPTIICL